MNRFDLKSASIHLLDPALEERKPPSESFAAAFESLADAPHALFAPLHYEPRYRYPLFIWLHGGGDDERQLQRVMPHVSLRNYAAIGPQGVCEDPHVEGGYYWRQTAASIGQAEQRVMDCLAVAQQKFNINADKVFIGGFQCGGTMAIRLAWRHPNRFAGAISVGGPFPRGQAPLARLESLRQLPLLYCRGADSRECPTETVCADLRMSHGAGLALELREYPCEDDLLTNMLSDIDAWMMQRVTGQARAEEYADRERL